MESDDIKTRVGGKGGDDGFQEAALEIEGEEREWENSLLRGSGRRRWKWLGGLGRGMGVCSTRVRHGSERRFCVVGENRKSLVLVTELDKNVWVML